MSRNELSGDGNWEAVHAVIHRQMRRLDMSIARLSRESGVSETTIRYIGRAEKRQRSTLVALSAALGCQHDYLVDVLHGTADPEVPPQPPTSMADIGNLLRSEAESLRGRLDRIGKILYEIDGKVDVIFDRRRKG